MGSVLPKPILSKVVDRCGNTQIAGACCSVNGYRNTMEDAHCMVLSDGRMVFGVFDGHSNEKCSAYIAEVIPRRVMAEPVGLVPAARLETICVDVDREFMDAVRDGGGSTGTFCILEKPTPDAAALKITIANVGDSRILVVRNGALLFATEDHKPSKPSERARIEACGGVVRMNRVDGDLAVSRAFGDALFKRNDGSDLRNQKVIAVPDVSTLNLQRGDIVILACDGVFEGNFSNEEVTKYVIDNIATCNGDLGVVCARTCDMAIRRGSKDNISCMVVQLCDGTAHVPTHKESTFVPGPPFPKNHEASKTAYQRMASLAGLTLPEALKRRYELFYARQQNTLGEFPLIDQTAFDMSDEIDINCEQNFFSGGPSTPNDMGFFFALAEGTR